MSDDELMPSSQRSRHCTHPSASLTRHTRPHRSGAKCCPASDTLWSNPWNTAMGRVSMSPSQEPQKSSHTPPQAAGKSITISVHSAAQQSTGNSAIFPR